MKNKGMDELKSILTEEQYNSVMELAHIMIMPDPTQFAEPVKVDGVKITVHSNEQCGHYKAHVHIERGDVEHEFVIPEGDILNASGKISKFNI